MRIREPQLSSREMRTILIHCPQSRDRDFHRSDTLSVPRYLQSAFPGRPCDAHFGALIPRVLVLLYGCLTGGYGRGTDLHCIDAPPLARLSHQVFRDRARRGWRGSTWISISAMWSQLLCLGVYAHSRCRAMRRAGAAP